MCWKFQGYGRHKIYEGGGGVRDGILALYAATMEEFPCTRPPAAGYADQRRAGSAAAAQSTVFSERGTGESSLRGAAARCSRDLGELGSRVVRLHCGCVGGGTDIFCEHLSFDHRSDMSDFDRGKTWGTTTPVDPLNGDCFGGACRCPGAARVVLVHERPRCRGQSCRRHPAVSDVPDPLPGLGKPYARVYHGMQNVQEMNATLGTPVQEPFIFKDCSHSAKCDAARKIVRSWCMWYGP